LALAAGLAGWSRLYAFSSDFWNQKQPSDWSSQEIDQLTSKSPWAKEVSGTLADGSQNGMGRQRGMGIPGMGGGMGGGGMGGGGMGGGRRNGGGMPSQSYKGTVRWETAKPVMEALKTAGFPEAFKDHYVISVSGFPVNGGGRRRQQQSDDDNSSSQSMEETLDRLKGVTALQPKTKRDVQAGVVQQPPSAAYDTVWFGFSKDMLALKPEDKEVTFVSQFGHLSVKTKFVFKDMIYRGELAI